MRLQELTQTIPDQSVDDEAVYCKVPGECPKGHVYGLGSLGKKKKRYADPGASTSQVPPMVPRLEFDNVVEQLRQVMAFMQKKFGMTIDGAGLSQPPLSPHEQQQAQLDRADPLHRNRTMLIGRCKTGLRQMSNLGILRFRGQRGMSNFMILRYFYGCCRTMILVVFYGYLGILDIYYT
ncbi:hypothetical protein Scep_029774 [Stephania cephalantha]|uniref:Uncharacterized protein n=1 Tax=Stephania cephalantha TaxID=152367 RepID=A0AAP0E648_9MAGN